jgi:hypothetical protein
MSDEIHITILPSSPGAPVGSPYTGPWPLPPSAFTSMPGAPTTALPIRVNLPDGPNGSSGQIAGTDQDPSTIKIPSDSSGNVIAFKNPA